MEATIGERLLWLHVLGVAVYDAATATRNCPERLDYVFKGNRDFYEVCDMAGLNPFYVRKKTKEIMSGSESPDFFLLRPTMHMVVKSRRKKSCGLKLLIDNINNTYAPEYID